MSGFVKVKFVRWGDWFSGGAERTEDSFFGVGEKFGSGSRGS